MSDIEQTIPTETPMEVTSEAKLVVDEVKPESKLEESTTTPATSTTTSDELAAALVTQS